MNIAQVQPTELRWSILASRWSQPMISTDSVKENAGPYSVKIGTHLVNAGFVCIRKTMIYSMRELVELMWGTIWYQGKRGAALASGARFDAPAPVFLPHALSFASMCGLTVVFVSCSSRLSPLP
jgi:hypothetical protein